MVRGTQRAGEKKTLVSNAKGATNADRKTPLRLERDKLAEKLKQQKNWFLRRVIMMGLLLVYSAGTVQMAIPGAFPADST